MKKLLDENHIEYTVVSDPEILAEKGIQSVPQALWLGELLTYPQIYRLVKEMNEHASD